MQQKKTDRHTHTQWFGDLKNKKLKFSNSKQTPKIWIKKKIFLQNDNSILMMADDYEKNHGINELVSGEKNLFYYYYYIQSHSY